MPRTSYGSDIAQGHAYPLRDLLALQAYCIKQRTGRLKVRACCNSDPRLLGLIIKQSLSAPPKVITEISIFAGLVTLALSCSDSLKSSMKWG